MKGRDIYVPFGNEIRKHHFQLLSCMNKMKPICQTTVGWCINDERWNKHDQLKTNCLNIYKRSQNVPRTEGAEAQKEKLGFNFRHSLTST